MHLAHIVDLGEIVLQQPGNQLHHARVGAAGRSLFHHRLNAGPAAIAVELAGGFIDGLGIEPALQIGAAIEAWHMHADGVCVGVDAHQQQIHRGSAAEAVLHGLLKILEPGETTGGRQAIVAAMGGAALMAGILRTEVVEHHLEVARVVVGWIGQPFAVAAVLGLHPPVHRVLHVKQGSGMGAAPHRAKGKPQGVGHRMGQPAIGAGGDVEQMEATGEQESVESLRCRAAGLAGQGILLKEGLAGLLVGFEHTPGKQAGHVELTHPGLLQNRQGQGKAKLQEG